MEDVQQVAMGGARRRRRVGERRPRQVVVRLSENERAVLATAAGERGLAVGAFCAQAAVAVARNQVEPLPTVPREVLQQLLDCHRQVRRFGVLVNQAVAKLNATGAEPAALVPAVDRYLQSLDELDDTARAVRRVLG